MSKPSDFAMTMAYQHYVKRHSVGIVWVGKYRMMACEGCRKLWS